MEALSLVLFLLAAVVVSSIIGRFLPALSLPLVQIALGAVIRGETYHFELVSNESGSGITRIGLDYEIPIANGVLTTENDEQCEERIDMKGRDCARCAVEMANFAKEFCVDEFDEDGIPHVEMVRDF